MIPDLAYLIKFLVVSRLMFIMSVLEPVSPVNPVETRLVIAEAIVEVTTDIDEMTELVAIAKHESFFRTDVLNCKRKGGGYALGPWQVAPRTAQEVKLLCSDLAASAKLALDRIAESKRLCRRNKESESLAHYASGSCTNEQGKGLARARWKTAQDAKKLYLDTP